MPIVITLDGTDDPEEVRAIGRFLSGYMRRDALTPTAMPYGFPAPQADVAWGLDSVHGNIGLAAQQKMRAQPAPSGRLEPTYGYVPPLPTASSADITPAAQPSDSEIDAAVAAAARSAGLQGDFDLEAAIENRRVYEADDANRAEMQRQRDACFDPETGELNRPSVDDAMAVLAAAQMHDTITTDQVAALIPPPPAVELDAKGQPWDPELHAASKAKVKDGTWRMRRNTSGIEPPPAAAGIIPPPPRPSVISPDDGAVSLYLAKALIERITQHLTNDPAHASAVLAAVQSVGLTKGFPQLTERPDLVPALIEELGWGE